MDSQAFTLFHVVISLAAIGIGFIAIYGLLTANLWDKESTCCSWSQRP